MQDRSEGFSRRRALKLACGAGVAGVGRLYAFGSDFWNKKDPSEWTGAEVDQLTNKSPWAKELTISGPSQGGMSRGGMGGGGSIGGMGIPGMGGGGRRRQGGGMPAGQSYKAVIRWESAKPILDALKTPLPEAFTNHYVISIGGIPLDAGNRRRYQTDDDGSSQSNQNALDRLKGVTYLAPKDKRDLQPGIVLQQPAEYGNIYFGFAKDLLTLRPEDKEVAFTTIFGSIQVKTKFNMKDMLYHGELAV
jgi:hypothetical protein